MDPTLPGITAPRPRSPRYRTPMPWQLPRPDGRSEAALRALLASPMEEPSYERIGRQRPR